MQGETTCDSRGTDRLYCQCICGNEEGSQDQQGYNLYISKNITGCTEACNCPGELEWKGMEYFVFMLQGVVKESFKVEISLDTTI